MSYEGGGSPGPAGPTGATGEQFSGVTGAILWYDGSAVTGNNSLTYRSSTIKNINSSNFIDLNGMGGIVVGISETDVGKFISLSSGDAYISVSDQYIGETTTQSLINLTSTDLQVSIDSVSGSAGEYLGSNGGGKVSWLSPNTFAYTEVTSSLEGASWLPDVGSGTFYTDYVMASAPLYSNANVQVTTINGTPDVNLGSWVVTVVPNPSGGVANSLRIYVPVVPTGPYFLSILVISLGTP